MFQIVITGGRQIKPFGAVPSTRKAVRRYEQSLRAQLRKHKLPVCDMNLFPSEYAYAHPHYEPASERYPVGYAEGHSYYDARNFPWTRGEYPSRAALYSSQVFVALHEVVHHIQHTTQIKKSLGENEERLVLGVYENGYALLPYFHARHVGEQFSDASAILYMLSNYEVDVEPLLEGLEKRRRHHTDFEHYTSSIIKPTVRYFNASPQRGLDLIECTWIAKEIISEPGNQPGPLILSPDQVPFAHASKLDHITTDLSGQTPVRTDLLINALKKERTSKPNSTAVRGSASIRPRSVLRANRFRAYALP